MVHGLWSIFHQLISVHLYSSQKKVRNMKNFYLFIFLNFLSYIIISATPPRTTISLNGNWEFEQTTSAWPPSTYKRSIVVPGLVHLAIPKIEEYEKFFKRPEAVSSKMEHSVYNIDYTPRYSWYRKKIFVP